jgi:hypothetical protein
LVSIGVVAGGYISFDRKTDKFSLPVKSSLWSTPESLKQTVQPSLFSDDMASTEQESNT